MVHEGNTKDEAMDHEGNASSTVQAIDLDKGKKTSEKHPAIQEPEFISNQETNFANIPPSKNCTYDIDKFNYNEFSSMTGVFFIDSSGSPCFNFISPHPKTTLPKPNFHSIPTPFTILSYANGLILCRDILHFDYHICNPFLQTPRSYRRLPPTPSPSHESGAIAVLATDAVASISPIFYVICLIEQTRSRGNGCYAVDAYSSLGDHWLPRHRSKLIEAGARVVENSGTADSYGYAYWLTEAPHAIVRAGFTNDGEGVYEQIIDIEEYYPGVKMQLGRVRMHGICLVCSSHLDVQFYKLLDGERDVTSFDFLGCLNKAECGMIAGADLELVRFEKDAVLWVDGRVVFWQLMEVGEVWKSSLHEMPRWVKVPEFVSDAIPYVYTEVLPSEFLNEYPEDFLHRFSIRLKLFFDKCSYFLKYRFTNITS